MKCYEHVSEFWNHGSVGAAQRLEEDIRECWFCNKKITHYFMKVEWYVGRTLGRYPSYDIWGVCDDHVYKVTGSIVYHPEESSYRELSREEVDVFKVMTG